MALIELVYQAYPRALVSVDSERLTPIHRLLSCLYNNYDNKNHEALVTILKSIAVKQPNAFDVRGSYSTPLHALCSSVQGRRNAIALIQLVTRACPRALRRTAEFSRQLPLHRAVFLDRSLFSSREQMSEWMRVIEFLVEVYPEALTVKDAEGNLPIHLACSRPNFQLVQRLTKENPECLGILRGSGETPLHVICYCQGPSMEDTIACAQLVVELFPAALPIKSKYGVTPLKRAEMQKAPKELLDVLRPSP